MIRGLFRKYFTENQLIRRTTGLLSVDILQKASNFLLLPLFLNFMTPDEYGLYGYLVAIVTIFSTHLLFNINLAQGKLFYEFSSPSDRGKLLFNSNILLMGLLAITIGSLYVTGMDKTLIRLMIKNAFDYERYRWIILPGIFYAVFSLMLINYLLISEKIKSFQWYNITRLVLINPGALVVLWIVAGDKVWARFSYTYGVEIVLLILFAIPYILDMRMKYSKDMILRIKAISLPYVFSSVVSMVFQLSDRFILDKHGTLANMGIYNLAITIASVIYMVNVSVINAYLPSFFKEQNPQANFNKTKRVSFRLLVLYLGLSVFLYSLVFFLLRFNIISDIYTEVLYVLPFLLISQISQALTSVYGYFLLFLEKTKVAVAVTSVGSIFTMLLYWVFVPNYGILGIASSLFITSLCMLSINIWYAKKVMAALKKT